MNIKDNLGLILIIVGAIISITLVGAVIGVPIVLIGAYLLNKKANEQEKSISDELQAKKDEIANIDEKLAQMEKDKEDEINEKLSEKQKELDNIDETLDKLEEERIREVDEKIKDRIEELENLDEKYEKLEKEKKQDLINKFKFNQDRLVSLKKEVSEMESKLDYTRDEIEMQSYGLYEPRYNFVSSTEFKEKLTEIRKKQKQLIKNKTAAQSSTEWTVDGSLAKGKARTNANIKQILRSFNNECEVIINKVKYSNFEMSKKRIQRSFDSLNKLYDRDAVYITYPYLNLKFDEMHLAFEYELKKQEEKELLREAREREREEKKLQKELEKEKKKFDRENKKINSEIKEIEIRIENASDEEKAKLEAEIAKLKEALEKNNEEVKKINEWKEKPGAGYVYIISNIGSFGEDVFKIGVTRRENPEDRVRELSSASVPFKYDTHVFIFSKDAYDLESRLHSRFDKQRVNKINMRKEFFRISMEDVKKIVEENKGAVHSFVEIPEAEEYRDTLKIEKQM